MPITPGRAETVNRARDQWISRLIDLSRRNRLLYFQDLKTGSLDLSRFSETLIPALLRSEAVKLSDLFGEKEHRTVVGRLMEIRRKAVENLEEKGLETMHLGLGIATWGASDGGRPPAAPVFLVPVAIDLRGRDGLASAMRRVGDIGLNPVLLHVLEAEFAATVPAEEILLTFDEETAEVGRDLSAPFSMVSAAASEVPGFTIQGKLVLGNFSFQKMRMVQDLKEYGEELAAHNLIAALAGDEDARSSISESRHTLDPRTLDSMPVSNELLILDADSSQQAAIAAALSDQDGVVQGPPGTGKSQTIANAIASFIGAGKKVLFVAEKRAALEVVARRLQGSGLGHVFLDLHGADIRRSEIARRLAECLAGIKGSPIVESADPDIRLEERRKTLNDHVKRMHSPSSPSGKSVYHIQGELLRLSQDSGIATTWKGKQLEGLTAENVRKGVELLREAAATPSLFLRTGPSPWTGARVTNESDLQTALDTTDRLVDDIWPKFTRAIGGVTAESGLPCPVSRQEAADLLRLVGDVQKILVDWDEHIFEFDLKQTLKQLSPISSGPIKRVISWCIDPAFRDALRQVVSVSRHGGTTWEARLQVVERADDARSRWCGSTPTTLKPCAVPSFLGAAKASKTLDDDLKTLQSIILAPDLAAMGLVELGALLLALREDRTTPYLLPNLARIERELVGLGFESLVEELRKGMPRPEVWGDCLMFAWLGSLMQAARAADPLLAAFNGRLHDQVVEDFKDRDEDRLDTATRLVRRLHAERAVAAMNQHHDQEGIVRREAGKKKRHLPVRQLLAQASDVVLSLCPCWMASPLSVSHLLDGKKKYFDVVIFDEASQVPPEDAIPSILRGRRAIVAGDRHQLPPTTFFDADTEDDTEHDAADPTVGFESVLDIMSAFLEPWTLDWHYRSRDERLIAFSNRWIYGNRLITFPSIGGGDALSLVPVSSGGEPDPDSSSGEVRSVVDLVLKHAEARPQESLGVIAMGLKHALRVEKEIWRVRQARPDLDEFFDEAKEERFFVKNLERVQGDERDAIILTVGYGKDSSGRLLNRFGPLNFSGGERRLNVAVTRARERLTVVSSFGSADMDPSRFTAQGVRLLRDYLEYAASGGQTLRTSGATGEALNAFEADVFDTLKSQGLKLIPQWGASRYRIDMVVQHPEEPGRFVLAIECDGASYHSAYTARDRDRLRQQQLEAQGWRFHRIWSTDWFLRKSDEVNRALQAYQQALARSGKDRDPESAPRVVEVNTPQPIGRKARPQLLLRSAITEYRQGELVALVRWILSDGVPLTDEEILGEMLKELGFKRRGDRIDIAIRAAITVARAQAAG